MVQYAWTASNFTHQNISLVPACTATGRPDFVRQSAAMSNSSRSRPVPKVSELSQIRQDTQNNKNKSVPGDPRMEIAMGSFSSFPVLRERNGE